MHTVPWKTDVGVSASAHGLPASRRTFREGGLGLPAWSRPHGHTSRHVRLGGTGCPVEARMTCVLLSMGTTLGLDAPLVVRRGGCPPLSPPERVLPSRAAPSRAVRSCRAPRAPRASRERAARARGRPSSPCQPALQAEGEAAGCRKSLPLPVQSPLACKERTPRPEGGGRLESPCRQGPSLKRPFLGRMAESSGGRGF